MATVTSPLLSFMASGKFAGRYTFSRLARVQFVRNYSKPSGAASPRQVVKRGAMSDVSRNWKNTFTRAEIVAGWQLYARREDNRLTAANFFIRAVLSLAYDGQAPAFINGAVGVGRVAVFWCLNPRNGFQSNEPGLFYIKRGATPDDMRTEAALPIVSGSIIGPVAPIGGTYFYQIFKDGIPRSGIVALAQTQAATYDQLSAAFLTWSQLINAGIKWEDLQ